MRDVEYFIPARETGPEIPLQRYLAPLAADVLRQHLGRCTSPGDLILDPTAQTPHLPLAAARLGRKAISSNFNPISTLLVRGILSLPAPDELDAATMQLGDSLKRGIPLRDHINRLYASSCERCSRPVIVEHFLWDGEESSPVSKRYQCPHCGNEGQFPVVHGDLQALEAVESQGVHYWYLLERLAQPHEPERMLAEELLQLYTSRNLYALTDLSMRIEGLFSHSPSQTALQLILLSCLDKCSKLAAAPMPRATASRLEPPSTFMERNVWHAFEEAYLHVRELVPADPVSLASEVGEVLEQDLQALVLNEPVRKVAALLPPASVSLIIGAPQAYYRPFWTLSYLWSGWLWGRHKATLLKPLLRRKTMGWSWYRRTLTAALKALHRPLKSQGKMVFLLEGTDLPHVTNVILAAVGAAFKLERLLYQPRDNEPPRNPKHGVPGAYRLTFARDDVAYSRDEVGSPEDLAVALRQSAQRAISELLRERGEALHVSWLHSAVYQRWARDGLLGQALAMERELAVADLLQQQLESALEEGLETGTLELLPENPDEQDGPQLWWLRGMDYPLRPLGDRLEAVVREILGEGAFATQSELEDRVYSRFPGRFTPKPGLVEQCLLSYGVADAPSHEWHLRSQDLPEHLTGERDNALALLTAVGHRLGYQVSGRRHNPPVDETPEVTHSPSRLPRGIDVVWEEGDTPCHLFAIRQATRFGDLLSSAARGEGEGEPYIVIAERRLELLRFRMKTELLLRKALYDGRWRFIKLDHLRVLSSKRRLDRQDLEHIVGLEPLVESPDAQLPLFS